MNMRQSLNLTGKMAKLAQLLVLMVYGDQALADTRS